MADPGGGIPRNIAHEKVPPDYIVLVIILCLVISVFVRIAVRQLDVSVSQNAFLLAIAVAFGLLCSKIERLGRLKQILSINPDMFFHCFIPMFIASTIYRLDYYIYVRCMPQVITMVFLGVFISALTLGAVLSMALHPHWTYAHGVLSALTTIPIQPLHVVLLFHDVAKYRYLRTMLEIESVLLLMPVCLLFGLLQGAAGRYVTAWSQYMFIILRQVVGGLAVGIVMGKLTNRILRWLYNQPSNALTVSLGMNYFVYIFCEKMLACSGALAIILLNTFVIMGKHRFTDEVSLTLTHFWNVLHYMAELSILMISAAALTIHVIGSFELRYIYGTLVIYLSGMSLRVLRLLVMSPLLNLMTYELNVRCLLILGWSDIKGCINLNMVLRLLMKAQASEIANNCMIEILVYTFLSIFVNTGLSQAFLRILGFLEVSPLRRQNLNNCINYIMIKRAELFKILKMKRLLALGNWHSIGENTYLPPPYENSGKTEAQSTRNALGVPECPGCVVDFHTDANEGNMSTLLRENELNILKAKKVSVIKQYELGVINKYCLGMLVHYFEIMFDSSKEMSGLNAHTLLRKHKFLTLLRHLLVKCYAHTPYPTPKTHFATLCFYFTMHVGYELARLAIVVIHAVVSCSIATDDAREAMQALHVLVAVFFIFDFGFCLLGHSTLWLVVSGIRPYFCRKRNVVDFCFLVVMLINLNLLTPADVYAWWYYYVVPAPRLVAVVRLLEVPMMLVFLCPHVITYIDDKIDAALCLDFDLATALVNSAEDVFEILPQLIQVKMMRDIYDKTLREERNLLVQKMEQVQKERPWIAITVKTKQAIRTSLTVMLDALNEFKTAGLIDNIEYVFIFEEIFKKEKLLRSLKFVEPCSPEVIFKEVLWMEEATQEYLFGSAQLVTWPPGKVVARRKAASNGVYIIVSGMLHLKYVPSRSLTRSASATGRLPIVDYLNATTFGAPFEDKIVTGHSIGELSVLTKRFYDCSVHAVTGTSAYWLSTDAIEQAMVMSSDPVCGLEARMWKCALIQLAIAVMLECPLYKFYTLHQIKMKLERAFVPGLDDCRVFSVTDLMDDVILLEGAVKDGGTGEALVAPTVVPRAIQRLTLPERIYAKRKRPYAAILPRLMVIPKGDAKEAEVMEQMQQATEHLSKAGDGAAGSTRSFAGQHIWTVPSDTGSTYDLQRHVSIIRLTDQDDSRRDNRDQDAQGKCAIIHHVQRRGKTPFFQMIHLRTRS